MGLQRQLDELKRVAAQPGPQGPPGPPGKLQRAMNMLPSVFITKATSSPMMARFGRRAVTLCMRRRTSDWVCLARAGRDGLTPTIRGTYDAYGTYNKLDIVASDGAAFVATRDDPGLCPGNGWQLVSRPGKPGRRGENGAVGPRGERGEEGAPAVVLKLVSSEIDENYN